MKSNSKDDVGIPPLIHNSAAVTNDRDKSSCFNDYFVSVYSTLVPQHLPVFLSNALDDMPDIAIHYSGIVNLLQKLKPHSAPGPDRIPNLVLKSCAHAISKYLEVLYYKSLETSELPEDWKMGDIVPIHKSGPRDSVMNYRPISLTSVCCKTLEHIIYTNILYPSSKQQFLCSLPTRV